MQKIAVSTSMDGRGISRSEFCVYKTRLFRHTRMYAGKSVHGCTSSERPWTGVVLYSSDVFASGKNSCPRIDRDGFLSKPTWKSVVPCSNEFAISKLMSKHWQGGQCLDSVRDWSDILFAAGLHQCELWKSERKLSRRSKKIQAESPPDGQTLTSVSMFDLRDL